MILPGVNKANCWYSQSDLVTGQKERRGKNVVSKLTPIFDKYREYIGDSTPKRQ